MNGLTGLGGSRPTIFGGGSNGNGDVGAKDSGTAEGGPSTVEQLKEAAESRAKGDGQAPGDPGVGLDSTAAATDDKVEAYSSGRIPNYSVGTTYQFVDGMLYLSAAESVKFDALLKAMPVYERNHIRKISDMADTANDLVARHRARMTQGADTSVGMEQFRERGGE